MYSFLVNDHYKGNRYRNQIVRQDFPTALSEQIREKENAERQAMLYHQMIEEQEQADALVARDYADRLRREAEVEHKVQQEKSEMFARKLMQQQNLNQTRSTKVEEPSLAIPPRPNHHKQSSNKYLAHSPEALPQLHYACLDLMPPDPHRKMNAASPKYTKINLQSHTPEKVVAASSSNSNNNGSNDIVVPPPRPPKQRNNFPTQQQAQPQQQKNSIDNVDSIHQYSEIDTALDEALDNEMQNLDINNFHKTNNENGAAQYNPNIHTRHPHHKFMEEKSRQPNGNNNARKYTQYDDDDIEEDNAVGGSPVEPQPSTSNYREKIERLQALKVLGLPVEEIREIDKRIEQERKDEELARMLQDSENKNLNQEELDRKLAIEAQDKELAKMLQEREKAKAKRAKERARQKRELMKQQQQQNGNHHDPQDPDGENYSNPVDMLQANEANMNRRYQHSPEVPANGQFQHQKQSSYNSQSSGGSYHQNDDPYSNPVDMMPPPLQQRGAQRPNQLDIRGQLNRPHPPRAHLPEDQNIAAMIDPTYATPSPPKNPAPMSKSTPPDILEYCENSNDEPSTAPPYMPIQGTRRSAMMNDKRKKQKERCNQQ